MDDSKNNSDLEKTDAGRLYIFQYDTDFNLISTYSSINSAAKKSDISNTSIYKSILGDRNLAGGFFWYRGTKPLAEAPQKWQDFVNNKTNASLSKAVLQLNMNDEIIAEYPSIRKAAKKLNVLERGISQAINGHYKTAYGFKWKLK